MKLILATTLLVLSACGPKLPTCDAHNTPTAEWSKPCRAADEVDTETGALDLPDSTKTEDAP